MPVPDPTPEKYHKTDSPVQPAEVNTQSTVPELSIDLPAQELPVNLPMNSPVNLPDTGDLMSGPHLVQSMSDCMTSSFFQDAYPVMPEIISDILRIIFADWIYK